MPTGPFELLIFLVLLGPGFAFTIYRERMTPARKLSVFRETGAVILVSAVADMLTIGIFGLLRIFSPSRTPRVGALVRDPNLYGQNHYVQLLLWGSVLLAGSCFLAVGWAAWIPHISTSTGRIAKVLWFVPNLDVDIYKSGWWTVFTEVPHPECRIFVQCHLEDDSYIEGYLHGFNRDSDDTADREFTLSGSIKYRLSELDELTSLDGGLAAVSARRIKLLLVSYIDL